MSTFTGCFSQKVVDFKQICTSMVVKDKSLISLPLWSSITEGPIQSTATVCHGVACASLGASSPY